MAFIEEIGPDQAEGLLAEVYQELMGKIGRLPSVLSAMSINPKAFKAVRDLNGAITSGGSTLGRKTEELISAHISRLNQCEY